MFTNMYKQSLKEELSLIDSAHKTIWGGKISLSVAFFPKFCNIPIFGLKIRGLSQKPTTKKLRIVTHVFVPSIELSCA